MAHINAERDNQILAPLTYVPEMSLKTPLSAKTMKTPLRTGRKALSRIVNTDFSTPVVKQEKKTEKLQEPKVKHAPLKEEDYPEIEKLIPYDPMEFQKYDLPEDFIPIGSLDLAGLPFPQAPLRSEDDLHLYVPPLPSISPMRMPQHPDASAEFCNFLQTIEELTIELPPDTDWDV
ncbi:securin isoform X1 [Festucalex cinctus]